MNHEITDFQKDVLERSHSTPVLVDFWADWCGPCKTLGPILERLADKSDGRWVLATVDTDAHQDVAERFGIRGIPNVKLFLNGEVTDEFTGAMPEQAVVTWLERALPDKYHKDIAHAQALILEDELPGARAILDSVLIHDPDNHHAQVLLAETYIRSDPEKAASLVKGIEEHSGHFPMADSIRTIGSLLRKLSDPALLREETVKPMYLEAIRALARHNEGAALEKFIEVIRTDRSYDDDGSRKACIAIFRILGEDHPTTQQYRRSFSSALY